VATVLDRELALPAKRACPFEQTGEARAIRSNRELGHNAAN
jgi:hypothetical protein